MAMLWAEERKADDDSWVLAAQTGIDAALLDGALKLTAGAGYFDHRALQGRTPLWKADDGLGNSVEPTDEGGLRYAEDYDVVEGFFRVGGEVLGRPWTLYGDLAWNAAAGDDALGWLGGATVGKCKAPLDVCVRYTYRVLPADAVVAVFTDSDFLGGGTDGRGHKASLSLQLTEQLRACVTGYDNVRVLDAPQRYRRIQADIVARY